MKCRTEAIHLLKQACLCRTLNFDSSQSRELISAFCHSTKWCPKALWMRTAPTFGIRLSTSPVSLLFVVKFWFLYSDFDGEYIIHPPRKKTKQNKHIHKQNPTSVASVTLCCKEFKQSSFHQHQWLRIKTGIQVQSKCDAALLVATLLLHLIAQEYKT